MSRYFAIQSWVSSHDNEPDYSGQQTGSRHVRSVEIPMFTQHGKANVDWFSDEAIAARTAKKAPTVSIKDKILPQFKRLNVLQAQMLELENSYRADEIDIKTYSMLRDIVVAKIQRQEVLLKRAQSAKPLNKGEDDIDLSEECPEIEQVFYATNHVRPATNASVAHSCGVPTGVCWIDDLSHTNSFKSFLQFSCKVVRFSIEWSHKAAAYYRTLKEV